MPQSSRWFAASSKSNLARFFTSFASRRRRRRQFILSDLPGSFPSERAACSFGRNEGQEKVSSGPKAYPLNQGDWSSCDESDDELKIIWDTVQATFTDFQTTF